MGILVVDDDPVTCRLLSFLLSSEGHTVWTAQNFETAMATAEQEAVELIILDILMPRVDGFELFKRLRETGCDCPVIFLSAKTGLNDKITGLQLGADDYVAKPFEAAELLARVQAVLRRYRHSQVSASATPIRVGALELNTAELKAILPNGRRVSLTPTEMKILQCLMINSGAVVSRAVLADVLWPFHAEGAEEHVNVYMCRLRKKLEAEVPGLGLIETVRGSGYRLMTKSSDQC